MWKSSIKQLFQNIRFHSVSYWLVIHTIDDFFFLFQFINEQKYFTKEDILFSFFFPLFQFRFLLIKTFIQIDVIYFSYSRIIEQSVYLYSSIIYKYIFHKAVNKFSDKGIKGFYFLSTKRRLFKFFPPVFPPSIPSVISENINVLANNQKLEKCKLLSRICLFIRWIAIEIDFSPQEARYWNEAAVLQKNCCSWGNSHVWRKFINTFFLFVPGKPHPFLVFS